jgi:hypothetical protein
VESRQNQSIYYNLPLEITTLTESVSPLKELAPLLLRKSIKLTYEIFRVAVHVGAGSRQDTLATTGSAHVLR